MGKKPLLVVAICPALAMAAGQGLALVLVQRQVQGPVQWLLMASGLALALGLVLKDGAGRK